MKPSKIRFAVVGLGYIAQAAVLPAFRHSRRAELKAFVSGEPRKLRQLGRKYGVESLYSYEEFDDCLDSGEIDAVYIALPNSMHREFTERAAAKGVHVLCEKPMAVTEEDCRAMITACERNGVKLMIAYRLHFEHANLRAAELARRKLGELRIFNSSFTFQVKDRGNIRLDRSLGGGPLYDIGIYCINAARTLFRDEPLEVMALSANGGDPRFSEVEEMTGAVLKFPRERLATFVCSFGAADSGYFDLVGTRGSICLDSAFEYSEGMELSLTQGGRTKVTKYAKRDQFAPELDYFAECIRHDRVPEPSGLEGHNDVRVIEALLESARTGKAVPLPRLREAKRYASRKQEQRRAPVQKPEMVQANTPHQQKKVS